ncbi:hypothetical protein VPHK359_0028 [Vibrio phage K359]
MSEVLRKLPCLAEVLLVFYVHHLWRILNPDSSTRLVILSTARV